jgi:hypothetical protein
MNAFELDVRQPGDGGIFQGRKHAAGETNNKTLGGI